MELFDLYYEKLVTNENCFSLSIKKNEKIIMTLKAFASSISL
jgi:hypothetical protein